MKIFSFQIFFERKHLFVTLKFRNSQRSGAHIFPDNITILLFIRTLRGTTCAKMLLHYLRYHNSKMYQWEKSLQIKKNDKNKEMVVAETPDMPTKHYG